MADEIPPPAKTPTIDPWRTIVDLKLDDHDRRIRRVEVAIECVPRIEKRLDEVHSLLLRVLDREATREPTQERELGNVKLELAKQSAKTGGKWGAIVAAVVSALAAAVEWLVSQSASPP